ncbi:MAG: DMT family transporter [Ignavibacteria bacterium]|nr:DMT family transporter [Ignavibacteria bacterium]
MNWFLIALISALLSAAAAVTQKKVLFKMESIAFAFWISVLNVVFSIPFFIQTDMQTVNNMALLLLFVKSVMGAVSFLCIMHALKNMEISGALPLMVLTPGLVAIFAFLLLGDTLRPVQVGGLVMLLAGTYVLEMRPGQSLAEPFMVFAKSKYHYYIVTALVLFTATSLLDKLLLGRYKMPAPAMMSFQQVFYLLVIAVVYIYSNIRTKGQELKKTTRQMVPWLIAIALFTLGYRYTQIMAIKIAPVGAVLAVKRISVFIAAISGGKLFNESNRKQKAFATAIMVIGAIMIMED